MKYTLCNKRHVTQFIYGLFLFFYVIAGFAMEVPIDDFPVTYSQNANDYLSPNAEQYSKPLLTPEYQKIQLKQFYNHYYSSDTQGLSPWSRHMVTSALPLMKKVESELLDPIFRSNFLN